MTVNPRGKGPQVGHVDPASNMDGSRAIPKGPGAGVGFVAQLKEEAKAFFLDSKLNILLAALPFAFISRYAGWGDGATFTLACLALCPLAERLGFITEQLAMYTNDTLGGLLNATFGNATEMIISAFALAKARSSPPAEKETFLRVVQLSLLGSVVSNLLLVMGTAFIAGGIKHKAQTFNQAGINVNAGMLVLATFAIVMPSLLESTHTGVRDKKSELALSRFESIFMFLCYCLYLFFQLKTHRYLFEEDSGKNTPERSASAPGTGPGTRMGSGGGNTPSHPPLHLHDRDRENDVEGGGDTWRLSRSSLDGRDVTLGGRYLGGGGGSGRNLEMASSSGMERRTSSGRSVGKASERDRDRDRERNVERLPLVASVGTEGLAMDDGASSQGGRSAGGDDEEELVLSRVGCFLWLTGVTVFISFLSEFVTDAIRGASKTLGMPMPFLTTILLPIVGNAAEHASAIVFAYKNRVEIALGVAVGSSTQVSMMVVPFCVLLAWTMGQPLDLDFNAFEAMVLFGCVLLAVLVLQDGQANYLKGVLLLLTYFFISAAFWCHKDVYLESLD